MQEITDILAGLGYNWTPDAKGYRMAANFRGGNNETSLLVYKDGGVYDFSRSEYFSLQELIQRTLNLDTPSLADEWLKQNNYSKPVNFNLQIPKLELNKVYDKECLKKLIPDFSYWLNRGISERVLKEFDCGLCMTGGLKNRFTFAVKNRKDEIIGFAGRDVTGLKKAKWKIISPKTNFVFPANLNYKEIKNGNVILVESIGDTLALREVGITCGICIFGTSISWAVINFLINRDPKKIIISLNNDALNNKSAGNVGAQKLYEKLVKYFDHNKVKILLPTLQKDLNDMLLLNGKGSIIDLYGKVLKN